MSRDVFPGAAPDNMVNRTGRNSILSRDSSLDFAITNPLTNGAYVVSREPGGPASLATIVWNLEAPAFASVSRVLGLVSDLKVSRVATWRVVAFVENAQPIRDDISSEFKRESMSVIQSPLAADHSVPMTKFRPCPLPAPGRSYNTAPSDFIERPKYPFHQPVDHTTEARP